MPALAPLVTLVLSLALVPAAPPDKITRETVTSGGQPRTYYLYVPPTAGAAPAPLIVMLHGSGRRGNLLLEMWQGLAKKEGIILAGPDSSDPAFWRVPNDGPDLLYDVVEAVRQIHPVNTRRIYLFGHSAGAVFGLDMGLLESCYFAAVAVSAGAFRTPDDFKALDFATCKVPFAVWVGTRDQFFPIADARATRDAFVKAELEFQLTEISGHDHNYYARADFINKEAWKFLSGRARSEDPQWERRIFEVR